MTHTPGPWEIVTQEDGDTIRASEEGRRYWIAEIISIDHEQEKANACLIASAPDMLAALERVANNLTLGDKFPELHDHVIAAIAKAKGE